jgi:hypothetical protein
MFPGGVPTTVSPFPQASPSKTHRTYNPRLVDEALSNPEPNLEPVDPRNLHGSQPGLTRAGVAHYMDNPDTLFADGHQAGNQHPVVFHDEVRDRDVLLSGHHRATAALLRGEQFNAVRVSGQPATHREAADYQREVYQRQRAARGN